MRFWEFFKEVFGTMIFAGDVSTFDMCRRNHAWEINLKDVLTKNEGL